jgi:hypothetical protein
MNDESGLSILPASEAALAAAAELYDAAEVQQAAAAITTGGMGWPFLSPRGGRFRLSKEELGASLDVVILASVRENTWYEQAWDPQNPSPPTCQAVAQIGQREGEMGPPETFRARQSDFCATCPKNAWGSSGKGRIKACTNYIRVALVNASIFDGDVATPCRARIAPTSLKSYGLFVESLAKHRLKNGNVIRLPERAVITEIALLPGKGNSPFYWSFRPLSLLDRKQTELIQPYYEQARKEVVQMQIDGGGLEE